MIDALIWLREAGRVLWEWIVDETRSIENWLVAPTVGEWLIDE
jgi:hypothetical protein